MKNNSKTFREVSKQKMIEQGLNVVAGVDLGDKHSHVCLIDLDGNIVERKKLSTSPAAFERYFGGWAAMRVVLEAGCHANWIYRLLERLGHEPLMADTHRLALITQSLSKDDRSDAERLAELGLRMPEMLTAVEPCSLAIQCDRAVLKARETLVETRTKLINSVRGTVKSFGERLPTSSSEAFVKKASPQLPDKLRGAAGRARAVARGDPTRQRRNPPLLDPHMGRHGCRFGNWRENARRKSPGSEALLLLRPRNLELLRIALGSSRRR